MFDVTVYLGREEVVGRKLDEIMWRDPEILAAMKREPVPCPVPAQELDTGWSWE